MLSLKNQFKEILSSILSWQLLQTTNSTVAANITCRAYLKLSLLRHGIDPIIIGKFGRSCLLCLGLCIEDDQR